MLVFLILWSNLFLWKFYKYVNFLVLGIWYLFIYDLIKNKNLFIIISFYYIKLYYVKGVFVMVIIIGIWKLKFNFFKEIKR